MEYLINIGKKAKNASCLARTLTQKQKNDTLLEIGKELIKSCDIILKANEEDIITAREKGMKEALIDRLFLNKKRLIGIAESFEKIASLPDPVGEIISMKTMANGLIIGQKRVPIGVIGMIYEARPNVTADAFSLCFKSGNAVILRGGKEAFNSNKAMVEIFQRVLKKQGLSEDMVQLLEDTKRETTIEFMKLNKYLDVLIPRGGGGLIQSVVENSTVPIIETGIGNCHIFVDKTANFEKAADVIINAKVQRVSVCNSCEKLVIHDDIADAFVPFIFKKLCENGVEVRGDKRAVQLEVGIKLATDEDWSKEYLDYIIAIKIVENLDQAVEHINEYSSGHSEAILTESYENSQNFLDKIDSACVYINASTRFSDGNEFGMGAEIGISTQKLHARGPVGLNELTSTKFIIYGQGQIRK